MILISCDFFVNARTAAFGTVPVCNEDDVGIMGKMKTMPKFIINDN